MKHFLAACAAAPLIVACATAGAQEADLAGAERNTRILIVNGERIAIGDGGDAAEAIERAIERSDRKTVDLRLEILEDELWDEGEIEAFAEAMAALANGFARDAMVVAFANSDFDFDFEGELDFDEAGIERHAERMERHAERMARHAERLAERAAERGHDAEAFGARMERFGLAQGLRGIESGARGIERALERGWVHDGGERVELDNERRAELEEALEELRAERAELAERLEALGGPGERREVRIRRNNGEVRAWVDGEEVTGSALDELLAEHESRLAGAPTPPPPPPAPRD
ncbi:MAG: hypothetical protein ABL308_08035 [Oceanicaulis sp.]